MRHQRKLRLYVFHDEVTRKKYFHDPVENRLWWIPPEGSILCDRKSGKEIIVPESEMVHCDIQPNKSLEKKYQIKSQRKSSTESKYNSSISPVNHPLFRAFNNDKSSELPFYLPNQIKKDSKTLDIRKICKDNFHTRTTGSFFSKHSIPPDELISYSTDTSCYPLLKLTPNTQQKNVLEIYNLVIEFCLQNPRAQISMIINKLFKNTVLIDETFIMLIKMTINNPNKNQIPFVWDLILSIRTFFPPSLYLQPI